MSAPTRRKALVAIAAVFILLLTALVTAPLLLRGRVDGWLQAAIMERVDATVSWEGAGLSVLRDFPNATLSVNELTITGQGGFAGDTLASIPRFSVEVALPSLVRALRSTGPLSIRAIEVDRPTLHLLTLENGLRNWDVVRASDGGASGSPMELSLDRLEVLGARLSYEDRQAGTAVEMTGVDQSLRGDFQAERFTLASETRAEEVSVRFAGVPYLSGARLGAAIEAEVDQGAGKVSIGAGELRLNELLLALSGSAGFGEERSVDIAFRAPGASIHELVSLVEPLAADGALTGAQTSGTMSVSGWVRGPYGGENFPALEVEARIDDGSLHYPDLPLPVRELALDLTVRNPGGDIDSTVVELRDFRAVAGESPVNASFTLRTPVSDPDVALQARGRLDLAEWARAIPLGEMDQVAGVVAGDLRVDVRTSDLQAKRYDRVDAEGSLEISQLALSGEALPHPVAIDEGVVRLSPRAAEVSSLRGRIGASDFAVDGRIDEPLGYAMQGEELRGTVELRSALFDLNEWKSDDELQQILVPERMDLALNAVVERVIFGDLELRNARGTARIHDQRAALEDVTLELFGGTFAFDGHYETRDPQRPGFDVDMRLAGVDVAQAGAGLPTLRAFAPVAQYASGRISTQVRLGGVLGEDMTPLLELLSGEGMLETAGLALQGLPVLEQLAERLRTDWLRQPALSDIRAAFHILDGRLHVRPFDVRLGEYATRVAGSQGIDGTMDYALELRLPRAILGAGANEVVASLVDRAGQAGVALQAAEEVTLGAALTGTVTSPAIALRLDPGNAQDALRTTLTEGAERGVEAMQERMDSIAVAARLRAEEAAERILAEAEHQAGVIRQQARALAETTRREGYERADALVEQGRNPLEQRLAVAGANRLRAEVDERSEQIVAEADGRADALVAAARERAEAARRSGGAGIGEERVSQSEPAGV